MTSLQCPSCGNKTLSDIHFLEWVPSTRPLDGFDGSTLVVASTYKDDGEGAKDASLECGRCFATWPIPGEIGVEFRA